MRDVVMVPNTKKNNVCLLLDEISMKVDKRKLEENKWKVSYVCGSSFTENKRGFPCAALTEPIILSTIHLSSKQHYRTLCTLCIKNPFNHHVQIRGFKTKRSLNEDLNSKQSFMSKFKQQFFNPNTVR